MTKWVLQEYEPPEVLYERHQVRGMSTFGRQTDGWTEPPIFYDQQQDVAQGHPNVVQQEFDDDVLREGNILFYGNQHQSVTVPKVTLDKGHSIETDIIVPVVTPTSNYSLLPTIKMGNCIEVITEKDYGREASIIAKSKDDVSQELTTFPICQKPFCERMEENGTTLISERASRATSIPGDSVRN